VKRLDSLGEKERALVEERMRTGYRVESLGRIDAEQERQLRALVARLLPGVGDRIDLAGFVDTHLGHTVGRGDRAPGVPAQPELVAQGLDALARTGFAGLTGSEQDALIGRMRRGDADTELGVPAKAFVDRLLVLVLAGYLSHPGTWERIGFNGPAYPEGYAWISPAAVAKRHARAPGARRL
jgi:hypothetical protein